MTQLRDFPMPVLLVDGARAWVDEPGSRPEPVPARSAATVMLVRDAAGRGTAAESAPGVEVFMLRRVTSMAFAPNMMVFPGGGVDDRDDDPTLPWAGPSPAQWASLMGVEESLARRLVVGAAREVFEECGVLLAGPSADEIVPTAAGAEWEAERDALLARSRSFAEVLTERGLVLRSDLLAVRDHWVTPECEPRRYDTWFFAAVLPGGQEADDRTTEAAHAGWYDPDDVLALRDDEPDIMLPPTVVAVEGLTSVPDAASLIEHRESVPTVMPWPAYASSVHPSVLDGTSPEGALVMRCDLAGGTEPVR